MGLRPCGFALLKQTDTTKGAREDEYANDISRMRIG
ncbi:hypothetical protein SAMN06265374_0635 [Roseibium denhamense]|uniref:Uncharacterized protein n=1 Tax=Roseibium denhamense TaxID=76305 RepID=A0ABY1NAU0_9HYPH|nr:hypothetical protein SAMN06265374_0635 [Roseibium denhamense]